MTDTPQHTALNERLRRAFLTGNSDLEANRAGRIAASQQQRLNDRKTTRMTMVLGGLGVMVLLMLALIAFGNPANKRYSPTMGWVGLIVIVPITAFALYTLEVAPVIEEAQNPQFASTQGVIKREIVWNKSNKTYRVLIDGQAFQVDGTQYEAFVDGETYILYHTGQSKTVLAAEHVAI